MATIAGLALATVGLFFVPMDASMDVLLPRGSETRTTLRALREIDFSAKIAVSLERTDPNMSDADFFAAADAFAASLDSPLIVKTIGGFDEGEIVRDMGLFFGRIPELTDADGLAKIEARLTPEGIRTALRKKYVQLLKPEGSFMSEMIRLDPLDWRMGMIERLRALSSSFGYDVRLQDGHLLSSDGRHLLLILETRVPFTDAVGSRELIGFLRDRIRELPEGVRADLVCGHLHTLDNERVIKRDVLVCLGLAGGAFLLLFLFVFRDVRANLVFALPFAAVLVAADLAALTFGRLSPMMLGLGSVIAGITVDYAIHVYVAVRRTGDAASAVRSVAKPVCFGALTTAGVFASFFVSAIPGYWQLAAFSLYGVFVATGAALFLLPALLKPNAAPLREVRRPGASWTKRRAWFATAGFALALAAALPVATRVRFDGDVARLDGIAASTANAERRFRTTWGDGETGEAIAIVEGATREDALERNDRLYETLRADGRMGRYASLSSVWKSQAVRRENAARWMAFWGPERIAALRRTVAECGAPFGFSANAFDPFFASLGRSVEVGPEPTNNVLLARLEDRFVRTGPSRTLVASFFPDRDECVEAAEAARRKVPGITLVSRKALSSTLARDYTREFVRIALTAIVLTLAAAFVLLRDFKKGVIVLLPALAGALGVPTLAVLAGKSLNVMNLISGIIVIGLCIDYGIFRVHAWVRGGDDGIPMAISLSAGTTIAGAAALLFARHPALYSVGLTLTGGIFSGYLVAMFVVPACCRLWCGQKGDGAPDRESRGGDACA